MDKGFAGNARKSGLWRARNRQGCGLCLSCLSGPLPWSRAGPRTILTRGGGDAGFPQVLHAGSGALHPHACGLQQKAPVALPA